MKKEARRSGEFDRIARFFAPLAKSFPGAFGLLDDAAVIAPAPGTELVVTTDTIVAGVHYVGDEPPGLIAAKLLRVNLSDLAAMGATARAYTLNIALPRNVDDDWLEDFAAGLADDQNRFGIELIGGDSVGTPGPTVLTLTAFGEVPVGGALRRAGAIPGDRVFVSGTIGDGTLGLRAVRGELEGVPDATAAALTARYRKPEPRLALGCRLRSIAHAVADVSDGLVADLGHIADASGAAAEIDVDAVPLSVAARTTVDGEPEALKALLTGGDDYELVFCAPPSKAQALEAVAREIGLALTAVGRIEAGRGVRVLVPSGKPIAFDRAGFTHG